MACMICSPLFSLQVRRATFDSVPDKNTFFLEHLILRASEHVVPEVFDYQGVRVGPNKNRWFPERRIRPDERGPGKDLVLVRGASKLA